MSTQQNADGSLFRVEIERDWEGFPISEKVVQLPAPQVDIQFRLWHVWNLKTPNKAIPLSCGRPACSVCRAVNP